MDHHVVEDAAGHLDIGYRGRLRIARGNFDDVDLADLAVAYHVIDCAVIMVKAAAEADLQLDAGLLGRVDRRMHLGQIIVDRLFTEDVLACMRRFDDVLGVRVGRGADQNRFDFRIVQDVVCILGAVRNATLLGKSFGFFIHERVSDGFELHLRHKHGNVLGVDLADTACADNTNFHGKPSLGRTM